MPSSQLLFLVLLALIAAVGTVIALAVLRHAPRSRAADLLGRGDFRAALAAGGGERGAGRLPAATAARHLFELDRAERLLAELAAEDPDDGEVLLERGLVAAYAGRHDEAEGHLVRAAAARADLTESITLHRAWLALRRGRHGAARQLFEEIEASLEAKLRDELGGDPLFAEWFLQAAHLWRAAGDHERAAWAWRQGRAAAPESRLDEGLGSGGP